MTLQTIPNAAQPIGGVTAQNGPLSNHSTHDLFAVLMQQMAVTPELLANDITMPTSWEGDAPVLVEAGESNPSARDLLAFLSAEKSTDLDRFDENSALATPSMLSAAMLEAGLHEEGSELHAKLNALVDTAATFSSLEQQGVTDKSTPLAQHLAKYLAQQHAEVDRGNIADLMAAEASSAVVEKAMPQVVPPSSVTSHALHHQTTLSAAPFAANAAPATVAVMPRQQPWLERPSVSQEVSDIALESRQSGQTQQNAAVSQDALATITGTRGDALTPQVPIQAMAAWLAERHHLHQHQSLDMDTEVLSDVLKDMPTPIAPTVSLNKVLTTPPATTGLATMAMTEASNTPTLLAGSEAVAAIEDLGFDQELEMKAATTPRYIMQTQPTVQAWAAAMQQQVQMMVRQGVQRAEIALDPPELGHMDVSVEVVEGELKVHMVTDNAALKDLVEASLGRLRDGLQGHGFAEIGLGLEMDLAGNEAQEEALARQDEALVLADEESTDDTAKTVNALSASLINAWA